MKQDGVGALYRGLSAGLLRQATYTTARLGIYQIFSDALTTHNNGQVGLPPSCAARAPPHPALCPRLPRPPANAVNVEGRPPWLCSLKQSRLRLLDIPQDRCGPRNGPAQT